MDLNLNRLRDADLDLDLGTGGASAPAGKSSLTSRLTPAPQLVFRVSDPDTARALGESMGGGRGRIQRVADRDDNGVAAGAEAAVDRAASSSGQALPTHLQRQFEQSTGADLSGVRVHTGGESATAAHAVGAKAYTVGQDIHFAEGRYQPDDPFGMHLLAHEVAHTVQQQGGTAHRQHKLEVSTPHDAAEVEADRAADAMVTGLPAMLTTAGVSAQRLVRVKHLADAADAGEKSMDEVMRSPQVAVMNVKNVEDRQTASTLLNMIQSQDANVKEGMDTKQVDPSVAVENQKCAGLLATYLENADAQESQIGTFQGLFGRAMKDFARLNEMSGSLDGLKLDGVKDAKEGEARGGDVVNAIFDGDDAKKETDAIKRMDPEIATKIDGLKIKKLGLTSKGKLILNHSNDLATALSNMSNKQRAFVAKTSAVKDPKAQSELLAAKQRAQNDYTAAASKVVKDALISGVTAAPGGPAAAGGAAAKSAASGVWSQVVKPQLDKALENANISVGNFPDNKAESDKVAGDLAAWSELQSLAGEINTGRDVVRQKADGMGNQVDLYEQERATYQNEMIQLGQEMDKVARQKQLAGRKAPSCQQVCDPNYKPDPVPASKGPRYETAFQFMSEADRFIAQCEVVVQQGNDELKVADKSTKNAASRAHTALENATTGGTRPNFFYFVNRMTVTRKDGSTWDKLTAVRQNFSMRNGLNPGGNLDGPDETHRFGSAEGHDGYGANQVIADHIKKVEDAKTKIAALRNAMSTKLGL